MTKTLAPGPQPAVLHVDADSFFASVEQRDHPDLAGVPVLVGGAGARGVVASASPEAKRLGVRSAMPMWRARALCGPSLVVVASRHERYREVSAQLFALLAQSAEVVEPVSIDEAYLLVGADGEGAPTVAGRLRARVRRELGITVSVGGGTTKVVAKMLSAWVKGVRGPGSQAIIAPDEEWEWLGTQPAAALPGCGPVTAAALAELGVATIADLRRQPHPTLARRIGNAAATNLLALARNDDPRPVAPPAARKQLSQERTFARDLPDGAAVRRAVAEVAAHVASSLADEQLGARTYTVKLRTDDFSDVSRSHTLPAPTADAATIDRVTATLVDEAHAAIGDHTVRLIGVAAANLSAAEQPALPLRFEGDATA